MSSLSRTRPSSGTSQKFPGSKVRRYKTLCLTDQDRYIKGFSNLHTSKLELEYVQYGTGFANNRGKWLTSLARSVKGGWDKLFTGLANYLALLRLSVSVDVHLAENMTWLHNIENSNGQWRSRLSCCSGLKSLYQCSGAIFFQFGTRPPLFLVQWSYVVIYHTTSPLWINACTHKHTHADSGIYTSVLTCLVVRSVCYWLPHLHLLIARIGLYHVKYKHMLNCNDITHTQGLYLVSYTPRRKAAPCVENQEHLHVLLISSIFLP